MTTFIVDENGVSEFSKLLKILALQYKKQGLQASKNSLNYLKQNPKAQPPKVQMEQDEIIAIWENFIKTQEAILREKNNKEKNITTPKSTIGKDLYRI